MKETRESKKRQIYSAYCWPYISPFWPSEMVCPMVSKVTGTARELQQMCWIDSREQQHVPPVLVGMPIGLQQGSNKVPIGLTRLVVFVGFVLGFVFGFVFGLSWPRSPSGDLDCSLSCLCIIWVVTKNHVL